MSLLSDPVVTDYCLLLTDYCALFSVLCPRPLKGYATLPVSLHTTGARFASSLHVRLSFAMLADYH
jgi:hypothetical protein